MARAGDDHDISSALGLSRPLGSYAPRTQRRYRAAFEQGLTREDVTRREREQRAAAPSGLARSIRSAGMRRAENEPDSIRRLVNAVGPEKAREILGDQLAAIREYKATGNPTKGRQGLRHQSAPVHGEIIIDLKPYTDYHPS